MQKRAKKCTKKRDTRTKVVVLLIKPIAFLTFSLPSASLDLKAPISSAMAEYTKNSVHFFREQVKYRKVGQLHDDDI